MTATSRSRRARQTVAVVLAVVGFGLALLGLRGQAAAADPTARASAAGKVTINGFAYHPPTLRVARDTRVVFSNTSKVTHTVTRDGGFDSGLLKPGKSFAVRFKRKGTFAFRCLIHPSMHGRVIVG